MARTVASEAKKRAAAAAKASGSTKPMSPKMMLPNGKIRFGGKHGAPRSRPIYQAEDGILYDGKRTKRRVVPNPAVAKLDGVRMHTIKDASGKALKQVPYMTYRLIVEQPNKKGVMKPKLVGHYTGWNPGMAARKAANAAIKDKGPKRKNGDRKPGLGFKAGSVVSLKNVSPHGRFGEVKQYKIEKITTKDVKLPNGLPWDPSKKSVSVRSATVKSVPLFGAGAQPPRHFFKSSARYTTALAAWESKQAEVRKALKGVSALDKAREIRELRAVARDDRAVLAKTKPAIVLRKNVKVAALTVPRPAPKPKAAPKKRKSKAAKKAAEGEAPAAKKAKKSTKKAASPSKKAKRAPRKSKAVLSTERVAAEDM